jgi:hypothetical protein
MTTEFGKIPPATPFVYADPDSDMDYSISCWVAGVIFTNVVWSISPNVVGALYNQTINNAPVTIDGVDYASGKIATSWIKGLTSGIDYTVTVHATFSGGQVDDRSFIVKCRAR